MFISKISIPCTHRNFTELDLLEKQQQRIESDEWYCNELENKIYIFMDTDIKYQVMNGFLKSKGIDYTVLALKGSKDEIIEEYHHMIED